MAVREKRMKKRRVPGKGLIVAAVLALVLLGAAIMVISMKITTITVEGNSHYSDEDVIGILFPESKDRISAYCYWKYRFKEKEDIPFIESYEMNFEGLDSVEIIIYEKSIVGCIEYMGSYMYFDKDGLVVESSPTKEADVPLVTGLTFRQIVLYQKLPVPKEEVFEEILNLTQLLQVYAIPASQIYYDTQLDATLTMADRTNADGSVLSLANVKVLLGDRQDMEEKISELKSQMVYLSGLSGVLHLETYDRNDLNPQFIFEKD